MGQRETERRRTLERSTATVAATVRVDKPHKTHLVTRTVGCTRALCGWKRKRACDEGQMRVAGCRRKNEVSPSQSWSPSKHRLVLFCVEGKTFASSYRDLEHKF